jgi:hypothetical protein
MPSWTRRLAGLVALGAMAISAVPAQAYLYWVMPDFTGEPVRGDEPGIGVMLPGATPKELQAHLLWNMRAGLNVAALQCQFAPALMTVGNYNAMLFNHSKELNEAYNTLVGYFKRTKPKGWQVAIDQYTTKTYNSFSTLHGQIGFCEVAGRIGRDTLDQAKGKLVKVAEFRLREFRNSLSYRPDAVYNLSRGINAAVEIGGCVDRKGRSQPCKA